MTVGLWGQNHNKMSGKFFVGAVTKNKCSQTRDSKKKAVAEGKKEEGKSQERNRSRKMPSFPFFNDRESPQQTIVCLQPAQ